MKNFIIIGGSSGIGKSLVEILEADNNNVFATYNSNKVESRDKVSYLHYDVLAEDFYVANLPDEIHGLAYCPGSINLKPFHRFTEDDFVQDYKLQVLGAVKVIQLLLPKLKQSGNASIVLFSTIAVQNGFNFHSLVSASKGAIEGLTRALAAELAPTIRVNAIAPSLTDTALAAKLLSTDEKRDAMAKKNPLKKFGEAKDIAEAAQYLLTDKSSWVTGQVLHVDGGASSVLG